MGQMPAQLLEGEEAKAVAKYIAEVAGRSNRSPVRPRRVPRISVAFHARKGALSRSVYVAVVELHL